MKDRIQISEHRFQPRPGAVEERHLLLQVTDPTLPFQEQVAALKEVYLELTGGRDVLLRRFFLSDAANQLPALGAAFGNLPACATSVVQQPPLGGCKVAEWVW